MKVQAVGYQVESFSVDGWPEFLRWLSASSCRFRSVLVTDQVGNLLGVFREVEGRMEQVLKRPAPVASVGRVPVSRHGVRSATW